MPENLITRTPLFRQIAHVLRDEILHHHAGQQLDSVNKLAKRFSVSTVTIREALLNLSDEGFVERRRGSGTYVRDRSSQQHVGIVTEADISYPRTSFFFLRVTQQLRNFFEKHGYRVKLYLGHYQIGDIPKEPVSAEFLEDVARHKLCGVVGVSTYPDSKWFDILEKHHIPALGDPEDYPFHVGIDYLEFVREGTRCLFEQGCRKIAFLGLEGSKRKGQFIKVFQNVISEFGAQIHERWVCLGKIPSEIRAGWEGFRKIWLSGKEKPDGLFVSDDLLFRDATTAILELGIRIPEQLKIVTHANKGSGIFIPFDVTRIEYDPDEFVQIAGEMLIKLMKKEPVLNGRVNLPFRWVHASEVKLQGHGLSMEQGRAKIAEVVSVHNQHET